MTINSIPHHVAIIMDGNGRWAKEHHLMRSQGHLEGVKRVEEIISEACRCGIKVLTLYAFSTENWNRPEDEVSLLMRTLISVLGQKAKDLHGNGIRIKFIGRRQGIPTSVLEAMDKAIFLTESNEKMTLNIAFNYGARAEIVDAAKRMYQEVVDGRIQISDVDEKGFGKFLYTERNSEVDLLIRTSGEYRISNFLLWQISYAEFYFTSKYWPDFTSEELHKALKDFSGRERRYGGILSAA
ncbi:MAG: isoprenyl transferase [Candidatus Omnitrophica bacterium]|nr:isoprenyl transferase [Candidatus Omnitrophota bacterium]